MIFKHNIFQSHSYYFNPFSIPPFLIVCIILLLGLFVLSLEKRSSFNRSFLYLCSSTAVWLLGQCLVMNSRLSQVALFWSCVMYTGLIFIAANVFHISITYTNRYIKEKLFVMLVYLTAAILSFALWNKIFFDGLRQYDWGFYPGAGNLLPFFLFFLLFYPALGMINLISYYNAVPSGPVRKRTKYLMIAFMFAALSNVDVLPSYGITVYPFGYIAVLCFALSIIYSIIKHQNLMVERHAKTLEDEVSKKTEQISKMVKQLKITQVKLIETGKISAIASLSAGILHQISQPITAIHGFVKFMRKEMKKTDPFYKPVQLMDEQSVYLKQMLEDLMELVRHRKIKKENISVNVCLQKAVDLLRDELRIRRIHCQLKMADGLPKVYADSVHLQQVFMNIMVNAMQALSSIPRGSNRRLFVTLKLNDAGDKIMVAFRDTGPGLSEEDSLNIFEPFFSTKTKGTGIGLALCKDLIAEHGGTIDVESQEGGGTKFIIYLPPAQKRT